MHTIPAMGAGANADQYADFEHRYPCWHVPSEAHLESRLLGRLLLSQWSARRRRRREGHAREQRGPMLQVLSELPRSGMAEILYQLCAPWRPV